MTALLYYTLQDLFHYRSRTILAVIALSGVSFSYLILAALSESILFSGSTASQTENLVIIPQDIVDPMDARLEPVVLEVAGELPADSAQRVSPLIFKHMRIDDQLVQLRAAPLADWETVHGLELLNGSWPAGEREIAISEDAMLVAEWSLGDRLRIYGTDFRITGIFRGSGTKLASVWMTVAQAHRLFGDDIGYQMLYVTVPAPADVESVRNSLESDPRLAGRYAVYREDHLTSRILQAGDDIRNMLAIIAGIALLGITFGTFNSANMNVAERRRELGILRAIGLPSRVTGIILMVRVGLLGIAAYALGVIIAAVFLASHHSREILMSSGVRLSLRLTPRAMLLGLVLVVLLAPLGAWLSTRRLTRFTVVQMMNG